MPTARPLSLSFLPRASLIAAPLAVLIWFSLAWSLTLSYSVSRLFSAAGLHGLAEKNLLRTLKAHPESGEVFWRLAQISALALDYQKSATYLDQATSSKPDLFRTRRTQLILHYLELGKLALAVQDERSVVSFYKKAVDLGASEEVLQDLGREVVWEANEALAQGDFHLFRKWRKLAARLHAGRDGLFLTTARKGLAASVRDESWSRAEEYLVVLKWLKAPADELERAQFELAVAMESSGLVGKEPSRVLRAYELLFELVPQGLPEPDVGEPLVLSPVDHDVLRPLVARWVPAAAHLLLNMRQPVDEVAAVDDKDLIIHSSGHLYHLDLDRGKLTRVEPDVSVWSPTGVTGEIAYVREEAAAREAGDRSEVLPLKGLIGKLPPADPAPEALYLYDAGGHSRRIAGLATVRTMTRCGVAKLCLTTRGGLYLYDAHTKGVAQISGAAGNVERFFLLENEPLLLRREREGLRLFYRGKPLAAGDKIVCAGLNQRAVVCKVDGSLQVVTPQGVRPPSADDVAEASFGDGFIVTLSEGVRDSGLPPWYQGERLGALSLTQTPEKGPSTFRLDVARAGQVATIRTLFLRRAGQPLVTLYQLLLADPVKGEQFPLAESPHPIWLPRFSPSGEEIFFVVWDGTSSLLYSLTLEKQRARHLFGFFFPDLVAQESLLALQTYLRAVSLLVPGKGAQVKLASFHRRTAQEMQRRAQSSRGAVRFHFLQGAAWHASLAVTDPRKLRPLVAEQMKELLSWWGKTILPPEEGKHDQPT